MKGMVIGLEDIIEPILEKILTQSACYRNSYWQRAGTFYKPSIE